mgnify:CR=1 FL=1
MGLFSFLGLGKKKEAPRVMYYPPVVMGPPMPPRRPAQDADFWEERRKAFQERLEAEREKRQKYGG